jgi:hypothetical protein
MYLIDELKLIKPEVREEFYHFIAHYVRKVFPDSKIAQQLRSSPGSSFLDMITPSDIAYVLTIVKNGKNGWEEKMKKKESGDNNNHEHDLGMYMHVANVLF